jgi:hypothetical protein
MKTYTQKEINNLIEENSYLQDENVNLTKINKELTEQLKLYGVGVTLVCQCGDKPKDVPNDGYSYNCNKCRKPFAN